MNAVILGVLLHAVAALFAANCYAPQKYIKRWSWETFWMTQALWCWLLWPVVGAMCTIPHLGRVLTESPKLPMLYCLLMGLAYGIGGTAFNLAIRYIGFGLSYAITIGLSAVFGTFVGPLVNGKLGETLQKPGASWLMAGMAVGTLGIALCGAAGRYKERDLQEGEAGLGEFSWIKGLLLALVAGVLSAGYGIAINDVAKPIVDKAAECGAGYWQGNIAYVFVNPGAFLTALAFTLYLARKNRSLGELTRLREGTERASLGMNYLLAILTGALWYGQFFIYTLGRVRLGDAYQFSSWAILMIMVVLFSSILGVVFHEWRNCRPRTKMVLGLAIAALVAAVLLLTRGNYLGSLPTT
jgi:L-rhamnose-H+ transport protein